MLCSLHMHCIGGLDEAYSYRRTKVRLSMDACTHTHMHTHARAHTHTHVHTHTAIYHNHMYTFTLTMHTNALDSTVWHSTWRFTGPHSSWLQESRRQFARMHYGYATTEGDFEVYKCTLSFSAPLSSGQTLACTIEVSPKSNMVPVTGTRQRCKAFEAAALRAASEDELSKNKAAKI